MTKENAKFQLRRALNPAFFIAYLLAKSKFLLITALALFLLPGCASSPPIQKNPEALRSTEVVRLSEKLESLGGRVIQTGQTMRLILPSDEIFNPHSANLVSSRSSTLDTASKLMIILETTSAQVSGYTDVEPTAAQNKALSARQAQVVADYLWSRCIDARLLYSVGYGASRKNFGMPGNFADGIDRRVEIKFQYLPLLSSLVK